MTTIVVVALVPNNADCSGCWSSRRNNYGPERPALAARCCMRSRLTASTTGLPVIRTNGKRRGSIISLTMKAMMTTDMKEAKEGQVKLDYSDEVVEKFVDYFYTQTVPKEVLKDNLDSFLTLSDY